MIPDATSCFQNGSQGLQVYGVEDDVMSSSIEMGSSVEMNSGAFIYNLSLLKDKVHQVQSLVSVIVSPQQGQTESVAIALASMGTLIQDIIVTASSMMFTCQQMVLGTTTVLNNNKTHDESNHSHDRGVSQPSNNGAIQAGNEDERAFFTGESSLDWYTDNYNNNYQNNNNNKNDNITIIDGNNKNNNKKKDVEERELSGFPPMNCDIIELEAADLLAKYTHYCQICGKGFKRDANLRMHMRAHGDEYKTNAALSNPMKNNNSNSVGGNDNYLRPPRKYSCPQEGCRWNKKHAKFQPLKSMICVKNHYKRTHCPKMYVCNRCNQKQFSVLSDLRTHEKHCGDLKWQCSCGTTFSRKDKLMGHVTLFTGHSPAGNSLMKQGKVDHHGQIAQIQFSKMRR